MTEEQLQAMEPSAPLLVAEFRKLQEQLKHEKQKLRDVAARVVMKMLAHEASPYLVTHVVQEFID